MAFVRAVKVFCVATSFLVVEGQHGVPPGVNPQQYQQQNQQFQAQPHQQQFQQPPQQFAQQPQQFQGQPHHHQQPQQQFQQVNQNQVPVQQVQQVQQPRGAGGHNQQVLHKNIKHETEHIKDHLEVPIDTSNMSEQELQFHYFKMHDSDGNNKLDGCELVKSLIHWHDSSNHDHNSGQPVPEEKIFKDDELVAMIDPILSTDDKNNDGFIDYSEFVIAQQAAQAKQAS